LGLSAWSVLWFLVLGPDAAGAKKGGPWTTERTKDQERRSKDSRYIDLQSALDAEVCQACEGNGWANDGIRERNRVITNWRTEDGDDLRNRRLRRV